MLEGWVPQIGVSKHRSKKIEEKRVGGIYG